MKRPIFLAVMLLCMMPRSFAIEPVWAINVSAGFDFVGATQRNFDFIRAFRSNETISGGRDKTIGTYHLSIMPECYLTDKFSLSTGLRVTSAGSHFNSDYSFFYFKAKEEGLNTYYFRINSIQQENVYVGVPLEFRFTLRGDGRPSPYFRCGTTFNFRCTTKSTINYTKRYHDPTASIDSKDIPTADNFSLPVYCAAGCQFGHHNSFSVEITFPYLVLAGSMSGMHFSDGLGGGLRMTYQFLKTKSEN